MAESLPGGAATGGVVEIVGIAGSLRRGSVNRMLLAAGGALLPAGAVLEIVEIGDLPHFDQDLEGNVPEVVRRFRQRLHAAEALWVATPEYNASLPGVLKNAIDWASRPPRQAALHHQPLAIMGASGGGFGTIRAQLHLREILVRHVELVLDPEVMISRGHEKFDAAGQPTDEGLRAALQAQGAALVRRVLARREGSAA